MPAVSLSFGLTPSQPSTVYPPHSETKGFHLSLRVVSVGVGVHSAPVVIAPGSIAFRAASIMAKAAGTAVDEPVPKG